MSPVAIACTTEQTLLGEGVRWDARREELLRVDILGGRVYRDRCSADGGLVAVDTYRIPGTVAAITPTTPRLISPGSSSWFLGR